MTRASRLAQPHQPMRLRVLLVFGLLAGLVSMHALGPSLASASKHRMQAAAHGGAASAQDSDCPDTDHGCDGHPQHADPTCASAAVTGSPTLTAPAALPACLAGELEHATLAAPSGPAGGRAPPSLAQLQLLRI
ncbi:MULTISPECIES: DUF6153 family protein [unclassified Streptomyces]|uniref:DUF6153 family protein n=1 Tax=unclassified Streptomyces TaxID=2593676 RepID=UPI00036F38D8|nr:MULTISPECIES: DUF6153 family protein [unclassified Streptomyces]